MVFGGTNSSTICITVPGSPRTFNGYKFCTKSSRGSCSVAASSPGSGASGGRWFGAAMPQAGRATDYCWLRGVVWVVSFAGLAAARRPCIGAGDSWGTSAPALVFDVQWVAVMVCESVFFFCCRVCVWGDRMPPSGWRAEDSDQEIWFTAACRRDGSTVMAKNGPVFG